MRRRFAVLAAVIAVMVAVSNGLAFGYFTTLGSGTGSATTGTLAAPTDVSAASTPGTGTVTVSWTKSTGTPRPSGYYVVRKDGSNNSSAACGLGDGNTVDASTCTDSSVPLGTYTYAVVAVYRGWTATSAASAPVTVATASQAITFTSTPPTNAAIDDTYVVGATGGGSGNPVTFSIDATSASVCVISGSTVTFKAAATCVIDADQAGSTYYTAAPRAQQSVTVGKKSQTITFTSTPPTSPSVGGTYNVAATATSSLPVTFSIAAGSSCSLTGSTVSFDSSGTCTVNANQAGDSTWLAAPQAQQSFQIAGKKSQAITITSTAPTTAAVDGTYQVTATTTSNLAISFSGTASICTVGATSTSGSPLVSAATVTFVGAGTCVITAKQPGDATWSAASPVTQSFPVAKGSQTITLTSTMPTNATVGDTYTVTATGGKSTNAVIFTSATTAVCTTGGTDGSTVTFAAAGTCTINVNQAGDVNYNPASQVSQTVLVFGITNVVANGSQNQTFVNGAGGFAGQSVTVYLCSSPATTCTSSTTKGSATVAADGSWQVKLGKLSAGTYVAQATQSSPAVTSAPFTFTV
jgi:hypothetical protein